MIETEDGFCCEECGADMEGDDCPNCYGEGEFDLYEDDPINYAPGETRTCEECGGTGIVWWCPNGAAHAMTATPAGKGEGDAR